MVKSHDPKVCICIPAYNASQTIIETLESILAQTYTNIDILVVDNASTDNTVDIINNYVNKDKRVKLFAFNENVGGEGNFTRCIQLATGDYTAIYHSDDSYLNTMVERQVAFLERYKEAGAVFTLATDIDDKGKRIKVRTIPNKLIIKEHGIYNFDEIFKMILKYGNFLICPSAMVRTEIYKQEIGMWDGVCYATSADLDVWLRILKKHSIGIINEPLMNYRVSHYSYSYNYKRLIRGRHDIFLVLDNYISGFAKNRIDSKDGNNYKLLLIKDKINRAISHLIHDERKESLGLLTDIFSVDTIYCSLKDISHFKNLLIGYMTYVLSILPLEERGRKLLSNIRYGK